MTAFVRYVTHHSAQIIRGITRGENGSEHGQLESAKGQEYNALLFDTITRNGSQKSAGTDDQKLE